MPKRGWWYVALVLHLFLMWPVYSSIAWADIQSISVYGNEGVQGMRRKDDDTYIQVNASPLTGELGVLSSKLSITGYPSTLFSCVLENNVTMLYGCTALMPGAMSGGEYDVEVSMSPLGGGLGSTKKVKYIVDEMPPSIPSSDFKLKVSGIRLDANYSVTDYACAGCDSCAGISRVMFTANKIPVYSESIDTPFNCSIRKAHANFTVVAQGTQNKSICLKAIDYLGQSSERCQNVTIDMSAPKFVKLNFTKDNAPVKYVKDEPVGPVTLRAIVKEDQGMDVENVFANLSGLNDNPTFSGTLVRQRAQSCAPQKNDEYLCIWTGIVIYLTESSGQFITFNLRDINGNENNVTVAAGLIVDTIAPVITEITTGKVGEDGRKWVGLTGNTITASIDEEGSGFYGRKIAIDFSPFGEQNVTEGSTSATRLRPNRCDPGWVCVWDNILVDDFDEESSEQRVSSGSILPVNIVFPSQDDAGNMVEGKTTTGMFFDGTPPKIIDQDLTTPCPTSEEEFEWTLTVLDEDSGQPSILFDTSQIVIDGGNVTAPCDEGDEPGTWECKVTISNLPSYGIDADIPIVITDLAGNENHTSYEEVTGENALICEAVEGAPPKGLVAISEDDIEVIPGTIDRRIASSVDFPVFLHVPLIWNKKKVKILKTDIVSCDIEKGSVSDVHNLFEFNASDPFIASTLELDETEIQSSDVDELDMGCNMSFYVRVGTKKYTKPDIESFETKVKLSDSPIGYIDDTTQERMNDLLNEIKDQQDAIDDWAIVNIFVGVICTIGKFAILITEVVVFLKLIALVIGSALNIFGESGDALWHSVSKPLSTLQWVMTKWIWNPPGYIVSDVSLGTVIRIVCNFFTCKLATGSKFLNIIPIVTSTVQAGTFTLAGRPAGEKGFIQEGKLSSGSFAYEAADLNNDGFYYEAPKHELSAEGETKLTVDYEKGTVTPPSNYDYGCTSDGGDRDCTGDVPNVGAASFPLVNMFAFFQFDPWKSVYSAWSTVCVPMILYNEKKKKQIQCLQYRCLANRAESGFDLDVCDKLRAQRECLYYYGASYKLLDASGFASVMRVAMAMVMNELTVMGYATATAAGCRVTQYSFGATKKKTAKKIWATLLAGVIPPIATFVKGIKIPYFEGDIGSDATYLTTVPLGWAGWGGCDLLLAITMGIDSGDWFLFSGSWDPKELWKDLEGTNYCDGIEGLEDLK